MSQSTDIILFLLLLVNLLALASGRIRNCIRLVAFQGALIGLLAALAAEGSLRAIALFTVMIAVKGFVLPWFLVRAIREVHIRREVEPLVHYSTSMLVGLGALAVSLWISHRLPLPQPALAPLLLPLSLWTIWVGLFLIVSRSKALMQVLGYLVLENGIFLFGICALLHQPLLVELGILLDVLVGVFVMGITIFHINREFDHIDTDRLVELADWEPEA